MKKWERDTYYVVEESDGFIVRAKSEDPLINNRVINEIYPDHEENEMIIKALDDGEEIDGWEDGTGTSLCTEFMVNEEYIEETFGHVDSREDRIEIQEQLNRKFPLDRIER